MRLPNRSGPRAPLTNAGTFGKSPSVLMAMKEPKKLKPLCVSGDLSPQARAAGLFFHYFRRKLPKT